MVIKRFLNGFYKDFYAHRLLENAASLSFYTLMSLVPIIAVLLGIAKGFGVDPILEKEILGAVPHQEALAEQVMNFARKTLDESRGGLIAGIGILVLLWSFLGLLSTFEKALNDIWAVKKGRTFSRRLGDFLGFIFVSPFIFVALSSTTLFVTTEIVDFFKGWGLLETWGPYLHLMFTLIPTGITFLVYSFFYLYFPNTRVPLLTTLLAAAIAAILFQLAQWGYLHFQLSLSRYSAIYGTFAAIPLFLLWLQMSWLITLIGTELSYRFSKSAEAK